jgi:tetratricopeptide (TPR) repeat protein
MTIYSIHRLTFAAIAVLLSASAAYAEDDFSLGNREYVLGNYNTARFYYTQAIISNPKSYQPHYQNANAAMQLRDFADAKYNYLNCLKLHPPANVKAHCNRALSYINAGPKTRQTPNYAPAQPQPPLPSATSVTHNTSRSEITHAAVSAPTTDAEIQKDAAKAHIMREAEVEIQKVKEEENQRWRELVSQSNRVYKYSDGSIRRGLSDEETAQFMKEVEQKTQAIRERAQRNVDAIR